MLYIDHNSTAPVDPRVADVYSAVVRRQFGNPSSVHRAGQQARQALEQARRGIARWLGVQGSEIVFTSGGTESNNLAIRGLLQPGMHAVTSSIEHPSVLEPFRNMAAQGVAVTYVAPSPQGVVDVEDMARAIRPETALVSLMAANNESGALQPVAEIGKIVKARRGAGQTVFFHCDGVQAVGKQRLELEHFDLFALSGHKVYAPRGVGVLVVRKGVPLRPLLAGGRQERGLRAGTENVAAAVALEAALGLCSLEEQEGIAGLRNEFERRLQVEVPGLRINAEGAGRLGNTSNLLFPGISGEALLISLDMRNVCVSTGSACSSGSIEPSHVLLEMGLTAAEAKSCIRFSFGRGNTREEMLELVNVVTHAVTGMRERQLV